jgi:putative GTP pyrophosphokinase
MGWVVLLRVNNIKRGLTYMDRSQFFDKFRINEEEYIQTGLVWEELMVLREDFISNLADFESAGNQISEVLRKESKVHSIKYRVKNADHLIEKIIRKRIAKKDRIIDITNYRTEITDLVGVRALHLFKEDWRIIHHYIKEKWEFFEEPKMYIRDGDKVQNTEDCNVENHPAGYRSIHYTIITRPFKTPIYTEIQVRTIFEEAWSEIDHNVRYPYDVNNPILLHYIEIFNRLAGSADEMGSYLMFLKQTLETLEKGHRKELDEKVKLMNDLEIRITELEKEKKISTKEKKELQSTIDNLKVSSTTFSFANQLTGGRIIGTPSFLIGTDGTIINSSLSSSGINPSLFSSGINLSLSSSGINSTSSGINLSLSSSKIIDKKK